MPDLSNLTTPIGDNSGAPAIVDEPNELFDWQKEAIHLRRMVDDWQHEIHETEERRKQRKVEIHVEQLRQSGQIDEDETLVPVRVIDTNIQREQPPYINYLKNSRRLIIMRSLDKPDQDTDLLEQEFTKGMTYVKWEVPFFKCIDGAQTHGWDVVEVSYDESKPLNCSIEHIGHEKLIFSRKSIDLQQCPRLVRIYDVTQVQLKKWVTKFGFDAAQVNIILEKRKNTQKENEPVRIYKEFCKVQHPDTGISCVYVSWFSLHEGVQDWLKAPMKLFVGIKEQITIPTGIDPATGQVTQTQQWQDKDVELYPIFLLPYRETEEAEVTAHKGRVYYDKYKQEAQTAILSGFINGLTRAANIFASPATEEGSGQSLKEVENIKLTGGRVLNKPINFWHTDYPDPMVLKALQYFDVANAEETNQVNFAAMNREDSRKTAKEIGAAETQQQLLNSVQLTLFSTFVREVYSFAWLIVQSQALQGNIKFLMVEKEMPQMNPVMQTPMMDVAPQTMYVPDIETISQTYDVRAAGDVDVVQKEEMIQKMQMDWPVIQGTALKDVFLMDYIKLKYPNDAEKYNKILSQAGMIQQMQSLIARLGTVLQGAINPEELANMPQQQQADVASMMQEASQFMGQPQQGQQTTK